MVVQTPPVRLVSVDSTRTPRGWVGKSLEVDSDAGPRTSSTICPYLVRLGRVPHKCPGHGGFERRKSGVGVVVPPSLNEVRPPDVSVGRGPCPV